MGDLLQSYAANHQYVQGFPSCFEEAVEYFEKKANEYLCELKEQPIEYTQLKNEHTNIQMNELSIPRIASQMDDNDETFWQNKYNEIKQQLENEKRERIMIETQRDVLKDYKQRMDQAQFVLPQMQVPIVNVFGTNVAFNGFNANNINVVSMPAFNFNSSPK